jgi:hypothetical protein
MKRKHLLIAGVAVLAIAFPAVAPGDDAGTASDTGAALEATPGVVDASADGTTSDADSAIVSDANDATVEVPRDPDAAVTLNPGSGPPLAIELPAGPNTSDAQPVTDGIVSYENAALDTALAVQAVAPEPESDTTSTAVADAAPDSADAQPAPDTPSDSDQPVDSSADAAAPATDGPPPAPLALGSGVRIFAVIGSPEAATDFRFPIDLPEGTQLEQSDSSFLAVDADGVVQAVISAPWGRDADGAAVPVSYGIDGTVLTLHVDTTTAAFPVVVDPQVSDGGASARAAAEAARKAREAQAQGDPDAAQRADEAAGAAAALKAAAAERTAEEAQDAEAAVEDSQDLSVDLDSPLHGADVAADEGSADASADPTTFDSGEIDSAPQDASSAVATDPNPCPADPAAFAAPATAVDPLARGFNTRQLVDYVGDADGAEKIRAATERMTGAGATVHRLIVKWPDVQPGAADWNCGAWGAYDAVVKATNDAHLRLILTPTGWPSWTDIRKNLKSAPSDRDVRSWTTFVQVLANRYAPAHPLGFEIWNEENSYSFWNPNPTPKTSAARPAPNPAGWARLYCAAVPAIEAASGKDPKVGLGGLAVHQNNDFFDPRTRKHLKNMKSSTFAAKAYDAVAATCKRPFDFVGYHPYAFKYYCAIPLKRKKLPSITNTGAIIELNVVRRIMNGKGASTTPIWNTEWGFPSRETTRLNNGTYECRYTSEPRQATLVAMENKYLDGRGDINYSIYFNAIDSTTANVAEDRRHVWPSIGVVALGPDSGTYYPTNSSANWRNKPSYSKIK